MKTFIFYKRKNSLKNKYILNNKKREKIDFDKNKSISHPFNVKPLGNYFFSLIKNNNIK